MDSAYIGKRITALRLQKNISEYRMSLELGQNKGYIQSITSGKVLPSMGMFLEICDYFFLTPAEFFSPACADALLMQTVVNKLHSLSPDALSVLDHLLDLLTASNG
ncbi:MAG: helix-turn-helix transcriptional regulator [Ruthenibacterium sp.]